jgi:hypothetical protein
MKYIGFRHQRENKQNSDKTLELAIVLTDDSINDKEKRIIHCKLYTVKNAQVIPFRPRLFK